MGNKWWWCGGGDGGGGGGGGEEALRMTRMGIFSKRKECI